MRHAQSRCTANLEESTGSSEAAKLSQEAGHIQLSLRRAGKLPGQVGTPISRGRENEKDRGPEKAWLFLVSGLIMREEVDRTSGMENP